MPIAELARRRETSYQAVWQMVERLESATGRRIREVRLVHNSRGELRWTQGVLTDVLMSVTEVDSGEAPLLPEASDLNAALQELTTLIREIKQSGFNAG